MTQVLLDAAFKIMLKVSTPFHPVALNRFKHRIIHDTYLLAARAEFEFFISLEYITKLRNARKKCKKINLCALVPHRVAIFILKQRVGYRTAKTFFFAKILMSRLGIIA